MKQEYKVVCDHRLDILVRDVNRLLTLGWEALGGIAYTISNVDKGQFAQALIKRIDNV